MQQRILQTLISLFIASLCLLPRMDAQGWERVFTDTLGGLGMSFDAKPTPDGGYIAVGEVDLPTGAIRHFIHLIKTDAAGNLQWEKNINDNDITYESARAIWPLAEGGYIIIGSRQGDPFVNSDIYLVRTDAFGDTLWTHTYDQWSGFTTGESLYPTSDGGYIIGGSNTDNQTYSGIAIKTDSDGNVEWSQEYSDGILGLQFRDLIPVSIGGYLAVGINDGQSFLMRLDASGTEIWTRNYPLTSSGGGHAVIEDNDGGFVFCGHSDGFAGPSPYAIKTDANGDEIWSFFPSSIGIGNAADINFHPDGGFVITGSLLDFSFGNTGGLINSGFLIKISESGEEEWSRTFQSLEANGFSPLASSIEPTLDGGFILAGAERNGHYLRKTDGLGNTVSNVVKGRVAFDENEDCALEPDDLSFANRIIEIQHASGTYYTSTDDEGHYEVLLDTGSYNLYVVVPNAYWESCSGLVEIQLENFYDTTVVDFPVQALVDCPFMQVDISTPFLRRCFDNNYYISYCNSGTEAATDATVEILLDEFLSITQASLPYTDIGDNLFVFELGDVDIGACGSFQFTAYLDCDSTVLGQTHCVEAHIFPDSLCLENPMPLPRIDLDAFCENDTVQFTITNIGDSDMDEGVGFIVIEDDVMYLHENEFQLNVQESFILRIPANGSTYRLETQLIPGVNNAGNISVTIEGCGTNAMGGFSTGFVNIFSLNDNESFIDIECRQNVGSYDPNDKAAFPEGYGEAHFIKQNTDIEYLIRFQNTGTDTAFRVEIRDTLSGFLNAASIIPGASSHPYRFELNEAGVVAFIFDDILLPDSSVNEAGSQGFVEFKIAQKPDLELGSVVENKAAIVFDFNPPVITNTVFHTIGDNFVDVVDAVEVVDDPGLGLTVFPNPTYETVQIDMGELWLRQGHLELYQSNGQLLYSLNFRGNQVTLEVKHLPKGLYWFNIRERGRLIGSGKFIVR